jgi:transposase InsO family protein
MNKKPGTSKASAYKLVKNIRRKTRQTYSAEEKIRIVLAGLRGEESISALCRREGISESLYYGWSKEFLEAGKRRLSGDTARQATSPEVKDLRAESSAYRLLKATDLITAPEHVVIKAADEFHDKTKAINEMWQTDFTYFKIIGWGWYYLSTILDDYSRYIVSWKLCTNMRATDVTDTIELALAASGCDQAVVRHKPRLLSDNGSCYISGDLAEWLGDRKMDHVRGAPFHPQTQGKIERWHQTMKNRVLLENYYLPGDLERQIRAFVDDYNNQRYHESLNNVTPADVYFGRDKAILREREKIKKLTIRQRRLQHQKQAA